MGTNECSQPASKSSRDSQDFGDISMVLKMAHFRKSTGPRWFKKALQFQRNFNKSSTVLIEENALKTSLAQWCQHFRTEWVGKYVQQLQTTAQTKVYPTPTCCFCGPCIDINFLSYHYSDVKMGAIASQITSLTIVYSTVYSDADQRKHQSSASLAFVRAIHRGPVNSPHKWPVTRKLFPIDDVIIYFLRLTFPKLSTTCIVKLRWLPHSCRIQKLESEENATEWSLPVVLRPEHTYQSKYTYHKQYFNEIVCTLV